MRQAILVEPKHIEFKEVAEPKAADLTVIRFSSTSSASASAVARFTLTTVFIQPPSTQWFRDMNTQEWLWQ